MTTLIPEENTTAATTASSKKPKPNKKARVAPRRAHVAPAKAKSARNATPAKKAPKGRTKREVAKPKVARGGSKTTKILDLLKRPGGATSKDLMKATSEMRELSSPAPMKALSGAGCRIRFAASCPARYARNSD